MDRASDYGQLDFKANKFCDIRFYFAGHTRRFENEQLIESMELIIHKDKKNLFEKKLIFDHEYFQNLCDFKDFKPDQDLLDLARQILGDLV